MAVLRQLIEPEMYRPCQWDLKADPAGRAYWIDLFRWHLDKVVVPLVEQEYRPGKEQLQALRRDYLARFDALAANPDQFERLDVLLFTEVRREVQARHGFDDPFRGVKQRANEAAAALLPEVLAELDAADPAEQRRLLTLGLMAGNIFDLGSRATIDRHNDANAAFRQTREKQPPRPWFRDDADAWWRRWESAPPYRHAVYLVDNAGGDVLLGNLPLARWMLRVGTRVTLAANSGPALNDITAAELGPLLARCGEMDRELSAALHDGRLRVMATGSRAPLLDLARLADDFVASSADADLIVLHGMGRAIESNFDARFTCDTLTTAVLKDEAVARHFGGGLFDCVFRFRPALALRRI